MLKKLFGALGSAEPETDDVIQKKTSENTQKKSVLIAAPSMILKPIPQQELKTIQYSDDVKTALLLESVHYEVEIIPSSQTYTQSTTLTFKNFSNKKVEGEFVFPLPEEAVVCGFALQIDDTLVDATVVEKKKAQKTFGEEVMKGNVVSLVEQVAGNQYRTKIYPWHANSTKTVKLDFYSPLKTENGKDLFLEIPVEASKNEKLKKVTISINLNGDEVPALSSSNKKLEMKKSEGKFTVELEKSQLKDLNVFKIDIPSNSSQNVIVENNPLFETFYFNVSEHLKVLTNETKTKGEHNIAILWDCSLGREDQVEQFKKNEFMLLEELFKTGTFTVDLYTFSSSIKHHGQFKKSKEVLEIIKSLKYDGATDLHQFSTLKLSSFEYCLLFTDGLDNISPKDVSPMRFKDNSPVFCLNSSFIVDHAVMNYIAEVSGGAYFKINENVKEIIPKIGTVPFSFLSAEFDENEITEVYPSKPTQITDGSFQMNGILLSDNASITLNFGFGSSIKETKKIQISKKDAKISKIVGILWAKKCLSEMECFSEHYKEEILSIGRKFSLVTQNTSLIVLETLEQHLEHKITPSKSRTQLFNDYNQTLLTEQKSANEIIDTKLNSVKSMWEGYMSWYNKDYVGPYLDDLISQTNKLKSENEANKGIHKQHEESKANYDSNLKEAMKNAELFVQERKKSLEAEIASLKERVGSKQNSKEEFEESEEVNIEFHDSIKLTQNLSYTLNELAPFEPPCPPPPSSAPGPSMQMEQISMQQQLQAPMSKEKDSGPSVSTSSIKIKSFDPNVPYIKKLKELQKEKLYENYFELRNDYKTSPPFYLDVCDYFFKQNLKEEAVKILTNLAELEFESAQLTRVIGYKFEELGELKLSEQMFRKVLSIAPHEPQSYRDLAIVLDKLGKHKEALQNLYKVVTGTWASKFNEIEITALQELNRIVAFHGTFGIQIPEYLINATPLDLRIVMAWDTDNVDIDIHTIEPNGEEVYYGNKNSKFGGLNSRDFTGGYGPETFSLKRAMPGNYKIKTKYFANHQQSLVGGTTILLTLFTHYGVKDKEKSQQITIRLNESKSMFQVGEIDIQNEEISGIEKDLKDEQTEQREIAIKKREIAELEEKLKSEVQDYIQLETAELMDQKSELERLM
jgi:Ca-activated chloride channel homolog